MAKKTQGTIDLTLGVNATLEAVAVKTAGFIKETEKQLSKLGPIESNQKAVISKRTLAEMDKKAKEVGAYMRNSLSKETSNFDLAESITKSLNKELVRGSSMLDQGKVVPAKLAEFIKRMAVDLGKVSDDEFKKMSGDGGLLSGLFQLSGKNISQSRSILKDVEKSLGDAKGVLNTGLSGYAKEVSVGLSKIITASKPVDKSLSGTIKHLDALNQAMNLVTDLSKTGIIAKGAYKDIDLLGQRVSVLRSGLTSIAALTAKAQDDPGLAESKGYDLKSLQVKSHELTTALKSERAELNKLRKELRATERSEDGLAAARLRVAETAKARTSYKGKDEETRTRLLKEEYAATLNLEKLQNSKTFSKSDALKKELQDRGENVKQLEKEAAALNKVRTAEFHREQARRKGLNPLPAFKNYIKAVLEGERLLSKEEVAKGDRALKALARYERLKVASQAQLTNENSLVEARKRFTKAAEASAAYEEKGGKDKDIRAQLLRDELTAAYNLTKVRGDHNFQEVEAINARLVGHKKEKQALDELSKALKARADAEAAYDSSIGPKARRAARQNLANTIEKTRPVLLKQAPQETVDDEKKITRAEAVINRLNRIVASQAIRKDIAALDGQARTDDQYAIKALEKRIGLYEKLAKVSGISRDAEIAQDRERIRLAKESIDNTNKTKKKTETGDEKQADALKSLQAKTKAYQDVVAQITKGDVNRGSQEWKRLIGVVQEYEAEMKKAAAVSQQFGGTNKQLEQMVTGFKRLPDLMRVVGQEQAKLADAQRSYAAAVSPKDQLRAANDMANAVSNIGRAYASAGQLNGGRLKYLKDTSAIVQEMVNHTTGLVQANRAAASSYNSLNGVLRSFIRYGVEFAALYRVQQAVTDMIKSVVQLEDALKSTQAIARATDAEMSNVSAAVSQVAIDTEYSTNQIAQAAQTLAQAGTDIREVGEALTYIAMAASATNSSLATTTDIATTMRNVFKTMTFQEIADQMTATINLSKLTGEELSTILSRAVEVSDTFNIIPQQMNAAFAVLRNAGIKASTISTGYRQALLEVFSPDAKTLAFLEKRYAELGQNLSQGTIASLFQGFARAQDPIRAVTEELEKLGYGASQAAEFSRVFDVRATNVLDVLVKQRDEYIKLTTQIDNHGAALKGNQTQMESLSKSWDNLGSIITVVANDAFGGMLGTLEKIVDKMGEAIQAGGKLMNTLKEGSGGTGLGTSLAAGVLSGIGAYGKTRSIGSAIGTGTAVAAGTEGAQLAIGGIGGSVSAFISEAVGWIATFFSIKSLLEMTGLKKVKGAIGKGSTIRLPGKSSKATDALLDPDKGFMAEIMSVLGSLVSGAIGSVVSTVRKIPLLFKLTPMGVITTAGALLATVLFGLNKDVEGQISAIKRRVEEARDKLKKTNDELESNKKDRNDIDSLKRSVTDTQEGLGKFFRSNVENLKASDEEIASAITDIQGLSFDLGSARLSEGLKKLQKSLGGIFPSTLDTRDIIDQANKVKAEVDQVEGQRLSWQQRLLEAYETDKADRTNQQLALIKTFEAFSDADKAAVSTRIKDLNQAKGYLDLATKLADSTNKGLRTDAAVQQGEIKQGGKDEARLLVQKAADDNNNFSSLNGLILQAGKDGDTQRLSDLRDALTSQVGDKASADANRKLSRDSNKGRDSATLTGLRNLQNTYQPALDLIDAQQTAAIENSAAGVSDKLKEFENSLTAQNDSFREALTPEQAKEFGLASSTIKQEQAELKTYISSASEEWQVAHEKATGMGKTTAESLKSLEESQKVLGEMPLPIKQAYLSLVRKASQERLNVQTAIDMGAEQEKALLAYRGIKNALERYAKEAEDLKVLAGSDDPAVAAKAREDLAVLSRVQADLLQQSNEAEKEYLKVSEEKKKADAAAGVQVRDNTQRLADVNKSYANLEKLNKTSETARAKLEAERDLLTKQGNFDRIRERGLNGKIYDLRMKEAQSIIDASKEGLMTSGALRNAMGKTASSYEEIADWFKGPSGQAFLQKHEAELEQVKRLTEATGVQEAARLELAEGLKTELQAVDERLAKANQQIDLTIQQGGRKNDVRAGRDSSADSASETKLALDEIKLRQDAQKEASDENIASYEREVKAGRLSAEELTNVTKVELNAQLEGRKEYLSKALAEEKKHIDNIRNLKQNLKDNAKSENEFKTGFQKQAMINQGMLDPAQQLEFDRQVVVGKYRAAAAEIKSGDKVNGIKDMNDAISEQQRVVSDLQRAEAEGVVSWIDTQVAYNDLLFMYEERRKATEQQLAVEEAARAAAKAAADAQLQAINALIDALNTLAERLATMPKLDLGAGAAVQGPGQPQQVEGPTKGVTGVKTYNDLRYETTVDQNGKVTYSPVKKYAEGGYVSNGTRGVGTPSGGGQGPNVKFHDTGAWFQETRPVSVRMPNGEYMLAWQTIDTRTGKVVSGPGAEQTKFATGGPVKGPGTGTSDSIPAMLSNGEYVMDAATVKRLGVPLLDNLRKGMPDVNRRVGEMLPNKALANMMSPNAAQKQENMQTAIFQLGDATIQTKAQPSAVQEFQAAFKVQSLKKGRRA
jgi:TP901 family phage tail tape measure protein